MRNSTRRAGSSSVKWREGHNLEFADLSPFWDLDLSASYRKLSAPSVVLHPAIVNYGSQGSHGGRPTDLPKRGNISGNIEYIEYI